MQLLLVLEGELRVVLWLWSLTILSFQCWESTQPHLCQDPSMLQIADVKSEDPKGSGPRDSLTMPDYCRTEILRFFAQHEC